MTNYGHETDHGVLKACANPTCFKPQERAQSGFVIYQYNDALGPCRYWCCSAACMARWHTYLAGEVTGVRIT